MSAAGAAGAAGAGGQAATPPLKQIPGTIPMVIKPLPAGLVAGPTTRNYNPREARQTTLQSAAAASLTAKPEMYNSLLHMIGYFTMHLNAQDTYAPINDILSTKPVSVLSRLIYTIATTGNQLELQYACARLFKFYLKGGNAVPLLTNKKTFVNDFDCMLVLNPLYKKDPYFEFVRAFLLQQFTYFTLDRFNEESLWKNAKQTIKDAGYPLSMDTHPLIARVDPAITPEFVQEFLDSIRANPYYGSVVAQYKCPFTYMLYYNYGYFGTGSQFVSLNMSLLRIKTRAPPDQFQESAELIDIVIPNAENPDLESYWNINTALSHEYNIYVADVYATYDDLVSTIKRTAKIVQTARNQGTKAQQKQKLQMRQARLDWLIADAALAGIQLAPYTFAPINIKNVRVKIMKAAAAAPAASLQPVITNTAFGEPQEPAARAGAGGPKEAPIVHSEIVYINGKPYIKMINPIIGREELVPLLGGKGGRRTVRRQQRSRKRNSKTRKN
jgi:hypothetical protein